MEKKHNRYEKPVLEKIDLVGEGQGGACATGPAASGECDAGSVAFWLRRREFTAN